MSDTFDIILNTLTMVWLIAFAGWLNAELAQMKIGLFKICVNALFKWSVKPFEEIKVHWAYLLCYPLIPVLIMQFLVMLRQFRIGKMYIKADLSFITSFITWGLIPLIVIGFIHLNKENNGSRSDNTRQD